MTSSAATSDPVVEAGSAMGSDATDQTATADLIGSRYLIKFQRDTLRHRPLWIRMIVEYVGTFFLVTVAAGSGVINHYA